jgi:BBSome-interacting protein 1
MQGAGGGSAVTEVLPKAGLVYSEKGNLTETLCKPKLMPLKSVTLAKLEEMEKRAAGLAAQQQADMDAGMDRYR